MAFEAITGWTGVWSMGVGWRTRGEWGSKDRGKRDTWWYRWGEPPLAQIHRPAVVWRQSRGIEQPSRTLGLTQGKRWRQPTTQGRGGRAGTSHPRLPKAQVCGVCLRAGESRETCRTLGPNTSIRQWSSTTGRDRRAEKSSPDAGTQVLRNRTSKILS